MSDTDEKEAVQKASDDAAEKTVAEGGDAKAAEQAAEKAAEKEAQKLKIDAEDAALIGASAAKATIDELEKRGAFGDDGDADGDAEDGEKKVENEKPEGEKEDTPGDTPPEKKTLAERFKRYQ